MLEETSGSGLAGFSSMESLLGFQDESIAVVGDDQEKSTSSSYGYKLVPWLNWNEWECVRDSLFSDSPEKIHSAITRVRHLSHTQFSLLVSLES